MRWVFFTAFLTLAHATLAGVMVDKMVAGQANWWDMFLLMFNLVFWRRGHRMITNEVRRLDLGM